MNKLLIAAGTLAALATTPAMAVNFDSANNKLDADIEVASAASFEATKVSADTIIFPATGDDSFRASGTNYWNEGDYIAGQRVLSESAESVVGTIFVSDNSLLAGCDTQDHVLTIDGQVITSFSISSGDGVIALDAAFPAIGAGEHTLQITTTETVASGCGSANFTLDVSTLDFDGGGDPGGPGCSSTGDMPVSAAASMSLALMLGLGLRRRRS